MKRLDIDEILAEFVEDEEIKHGTQVRIEICGERICDVEVERIAEDLMEFKIIKNR